MLNFWGGKEKKKRLKKIRRTQKRKVKNVKENCDTAGESKNRWSLRVYFRQLGGGGIRERRDLSIGKKEQNLMRGRVS